MAQTAEGVIGPAAGIRRLEGKGPIAYGRWHRRLPRGGNTACVGRYVGEG